MPRPRLSFVLGMAHTLPVLQMAGLTLELPAGLIDPGESPAAAALRELKEETGYAATVRPD